MAENTTVQDIEEKELREALEHVSKDTTQNFRRMFLRYKKKQAIERYPECCCAKCGSSVWERESAGAWYCFRCGSRGYWQNGTFYQRGLAHDNC